MNRLFNFTGLFFLTLIFLYSCTDQSGTTADTIIINAAVYTVDPKQPNAEAVAIKDGKILAVGSKATIEKLKGANTETIDAGGKFLMPGFIEGHGHIHGLGASLINLDLMNVKNWEEVIRLVAKAAAKAKPGDWIIGRGWHQEKWDHAPQPNHMGYPYQISLDSISPQNPVLLSHASGHSVYANSKAFEFAQINKNTQDPTGGSIVKDAKGTLVGVLEEKAQNLVWNAFETWETQIPLETRKQRWQESMRLAEQECLKNGITSFQDAGSSFQEVEWMKELAEQNKFSIRHWVMVREGLSTLKKNISQFSINKAGNDHLTVNAVKVSLDGALGSYGAWLLAPYADRKDWTGLNTFSIDSLKAIADLCWDNNLQLCVHAIGDRANRETLDIYAAQQIKNKKAKDHRWRIEHAQHVDPADIPRFKTYNVIASMQSVHCTSDAPFVPKRLGDERSASGAYMWKAFLKEGVVVTNGTDVPVERIDPFTCYYAAVTRKMADGKAFYPDQCMTREEALYSYTMANAYAAFQEKEKGSIEIGKWADLVLLDRNLINCKEEEIKQTKVEFSMVGGLIKYRNK